MVTADVTPHPPLLPPHTSSSSSLTAHRSRAGGGAAGDSGGLGARAAIDAGAAAEVARDATGDGIISGGGSDD